MDAIGCMDASTVNDNDNDKVQSYLAKPLKRHFAKGQLFYCLHLEAVRSKCLFRDAGLALFIADSKESEATMVVFAFK